MNRVIILLAVFVVPVLAIKDLDKVPASEWIQLFNGKDLEHWVPNMSVRYCFLNDFSNQ